MTADGEPRQSWRASCALRPNGAEVAEAEEKALATGASQAIVDDLRAALRDERVRYVSVRREGNGMLALLRSVEDRDRTREVIRRMEQAHDIVVALANAVEAKDLGLKDHCRYLAYRSARLAAYVGLREGELEGVAYGALLHDIGKIGISEHVLHKPGPLTEDEFRVMREHPEIGERICDPLRMSRDFTPIIRHHHERWDGQGYPDG